MGIWIFGDTDHVLCREVVFCCLSYVPLNYYYHHASIIQLDGEDYIGIRTEISLGDRKTCIAIIIVEDKYPELDESFTVAVEGSKVTAEVIILDDGNRSCVIVLVYILIYIFRDIV